MKIALWVIAVCCCIRIIQNQIQLACLIASRKAEKVHIKMLRELGERIDETQEEVRDYQDNLNDLQDWLREQNAGKEV